VAGAGGGRLTEEGSGKLGGSNSIGPVAGVGRDATGLAAAGRWLAKAVKGVGRGLWAGTGVAEKVLLLTGGLEALTGAVEAVGVGLARAPGAAGLAMRTSP